MNECLDQQVALLMQAEDAELVPFFSTGSPYFEAGFDDAATDAIGFADDHEAPLLQLVLATLNQNHELASKLAERFREPLAAVAKTLISKAIERRLEESAENAA